MTLIQYWNYLLMFIYVSTYREPLYLFMPCLQHHAVIPSCRLPSSIFLLFSARLCDLEGWSLWAAAPGLLFRLLWYPADGKHGQEVVGRRGRSSGWEPFFPCSCGYSSNQTLLIPFFSSCSCKPNVRLMAFRISISNHGDLNNSLLIISCCCFLLCPHLCK